MLSISKAEFRPVFAILALLSAIFLAGSAIGQEEQDIFTWTDDNGVRHFSAYPPIDRAYERVDTLLPATTRTRTPSARTESQQAPALPEVSPSGPDPEEMAERCQQARSNLGLLREDRPAVLRQEEGEPTPLDDERRRELIEETEQFIDEWC